MDDKEVTRVVVGVTDAILGAVSAVPGTPEGALYASLMGLLSLEAFNKVVGAMVRAKLITRTGHMLCLTEGGRAFLYAGNLRPKDA